MADRTRSGSVSTAKGRRKNDAARNTAHGQATRGRTKKGLDVPAQPTAGSARAASGPAVQEPATATPERVAAKGRAGDRSYVVGEHARRDTGALAVVLDLGAPDAPADGYQPDEEGREYAVECVTHHSGPTYFGNPGQARQAAKASHKWCAGCATDVTLAPKVVNKATAQTRKRRLG